MLCKLPWSEQSLQSSLTCRNLTRNTKKLHHQGIPSAILGIPVMRMVVVWKTLYQIQDLCVKGMIDFDNTLFFLENDIKHSHACVCNIQLIMSFCRMLPSAFGKRFIQKEGTKAKKAKIFSCDRDIICLPNYMRKGESIQIPRNQKTREFLGRNGLIGKIHLESSMTEEEIFLEIRSVFQNAMGSSKTFAFEILQHAGGSSKMLTVPALSLSFKWTASCVASKSPKTPIYILAIDDVKV